MSEPENFLNRWSRRKRAPEAEPAPPKETAPETPPAAESREANSDSKPEASEPSQAPVPEFDVSSLPSLDSINAQTDIRAFLQAGVPNDLRLAALRRAWTADPAIRNFKGLAENDWDFNDPNSMMGFGPLDPGTDVKKMLAQLFSGPAEAETKEPAAALPAPEEQAALAAPKTATEADPASELSEPDTVGVVQDELLQCKENIAAQNNGDDDLDSRPRSHGGALPH